MGHRAGIDEANQMHLPRHVLEELRQQQSRLQIHYIALVRIGFADRIRTHRVRAAEPHFLRDVQVLRGDLAVDRAVERDPIGDALQPRGMVGELLVTPVGVRPRHCLIHRQRGRGLDVEVAEKLGERIAARPAAAEIVEVVAVQARPPDVGLLVRHRRGQVHLVLEGLGVKAGQRVKVGVARANQRIAAVDARDLGGAVRLQGLELLAQLVFEGGVGDPERRLAELCLVGRAAISQPGTRGQHPKTGYIPAPERIVEVHRRPYAVLAGVAVAGVVGFDASRNAPPRRHVDDQVGCADRGAGCQGGSHAHAGNVGEQQQAVLQRGDGDRVAAVQAVEQAVRQTIRKVGLVAQGDAAVAAFDHFDGHGPVLDVLRWQIGLRYEIPVPVVMARNLCRHRAQLGEREFVARLEPGERDEFGFGIQRLPRHPERVDDDLDAIGSRRGRRAASLDADLRNGFLQHGRGRNLLHLAASAWRDLGKGALAQRQQGNGD